MSALQSPSEFLAELCQDGRTPGDRELALAEVVALADIADSLRIISETLHTLDEGRVEITTDG